MHYAYHLESWPIPVGEKCVMEWIELNQVVPPNTSTYLFIAVGFWTNDEVLVTRMKTVNRSMDGIKRFAIWGDSMRQAISPKW